MMYDNLLFCYSIYFDEELNKQNLYYACKQGHFSLSHMKGKPRMSEVNNGW